MLNRFEQFSSIMFGIWRDIQRLERDEMIKYGYKGAYAQYLVALSQHPDGLIVSRISEICDKDKAAVSRIMAEMLENGLVCRADGAVNGYRGKLKLTETGREIAERVCENARIAVAAVGQEMTEEEREIFYQTLERISSRLDELAKNGISE